MMISNLGKIGVFDSGLGGLVILKSIREKLPQYDYEFYGDTKNLPYGNKNQREIFKFTVKGIKYLINEGCLLIIIACNSASAKALKEIQQEWLPENAPHIKIMGVVVPTIEALGKSDFPAGIIATKSTIESKVYQKELNKLFSGKKLTARSAPKLATLIEMENLNSAELYALKIISSFNDEIKTLILGCTHYPLIAKAIQKQWPKLKLLNQTKIIPKSLKKYLKNHSEIQSKLSTKKSVSTYFTKNTPAYTKLSKDWF